MPAPDAPVTKNVPPAVPPLVPSKVISELLTMPPLKFISKVVDGANLSVPALTVVKPVKVLLPVSVNVPDPTFVSAIEPEPF